MKQEASITIVLAVLWFLLFGSLGMVVSTFIHGSQVFELISFHFASTEISWTFLFDTLSAPIFAMVASLGLVVGHYSIRYLDGEERQGYFYRYLLGLILSISSLVLANNLIMFFMMWVLGSYNLHRLLLFYPDRPNARSATFKKQVVSRISDVAILLAVILMINLFGTTNLSTLLASSQADIPAWSTELIGILLVLAAASMSAQVPFHAWLPETMETPTPISALMHAGVINAGGFLIIRFSPILSQASIAHGILILLGALTAVYASLVMITQNNIKAKLAYSTVSQMAMMLLACGLGAYSVALFHIIAHSFYKSHAFLTTGELVEESKKVSYKLKGPTWLSSLIIASIGLGLIYFGQTWSDGHYLAFFVYGAIMLVAIGQNRFLRSAAPFSRWAVWSTISLLFAGGIVAYIIIEHMMAQLLYGVVPSVSDSSALAHDNIIVIYIAFALFVEAYELSGKLMNPKTDAMKRVYMFLWNGAYVEALSHRFLAKIFRRPADGYKA